LFLGRDVGGDSWRRLESKLLMVDHQLNTLRIYKMLAEMRAAWGGALVFCCGTEAMRGGIAPAASIAGAATLALVDDGHEAKKAFRRGEVDFIVNTLDEALRALKNEVRQKRPLSVALVSDVDAAVAEMVERGVQPDEMVSVGELPQVVRALMDRGAPLREMDAETRTMMQVRGYSYDEYFVETPTATKMREVDARLLRLMPKDEMVRRRWVEKAAQYLRGASDGRWVYLDEGEAGLLESEGFKLRSPEGLQPTAP